MLAGFVAIWVGAVALGTLVVLRERWRARDGVIRLTSARLVIEAGCLLLGAGGLISGLGLLASAVIR